ncbi:MAG TPA: hypothetical protein VN042_13340 [Asticcacaulis sp.]|nr:hypothetical protein [Asticcacaulis sp.]
MTAQPVSSSVALKTDVAIDADILVLGDGFAGLLTALALSEGERRIVIIASPRARGINLLLFTPTQAQKLAALTGKRATLLTEFGDSGVEEANLIDALRAACPETVRHIEGDVARILPHRQTPQVELSDGRRVSGRLLVIATTPSPELFSALGLRRYVMSEAHLHRICLKLAPRGDLTAPDAFAIPVPGGGQARVFPLLDSPGALGLELHLYDPSDSERLRAFRTMPETALFAALPHLKDRLSGYRVQGTAQLRVCDLYDVARPSRSGLVLIGQARRGDCPAIDDMRLLDDLEALQRLAPQWLEQGADLHRLDAFYDDEARRRREAVAHRHAMLMRRAAVEPGPLQRLRRALSRSAAAPQPASSLRSGQRVRVRNAVEILATLDADGRLEGLPFMPEMVAQIGAIKTIRSRAGRACVEGEGLRGMNNAVFLDEARCDGGHHEGCQRGCDVFWKTAWLSIDLTPTLVDAAERAARLRLLHLATRRGDRYLCQSTALSVATYPLSQMHTGALLREAVQGDMSLVQLLRLARRALINKTRRLFGLPELDLIVGEPGKKSRGALDLKPGDWVRVRDAEAIRATLDPSSRNLGLSFEPEMALAIGQVRQVDQVVTRIVHEITGKMIGLTRTVTLKGLVCEGVCAKHCPRANPLFWREAWLERVAAPDQVSDSSSSQS